jgi:hypothetical protein
MDETTRAHLTVLWAVAASEDEDGDHPFDGHCWRCM